MLWEERLLRELDDLELQAEGLHLAERDAAIAELTVSAYSEVDLASRLHASLGGDLQVVLTGGATVEGVLTRAGRDWVLLSRHRVETVVPTWAVLRVRGASGKARPESVRPVRARLGLGSALRQVAASRDEVAVTLTDGEVLRGRITRVGADFAEVAGEGGRADLVAFGALVLLRRG